MRRRNLLIVFEGIDGVGKTTISRAFVEELHKRRIPAIWHKVFDKQHRGYNTFKPYVKRYSPVNASLFFYIASIIHRSNKVHDKLKTHWVVCDRCVYTTLAHHAAMGADLRAINITQLPLPKPDYYFLLTVDEKIRFQRMRKRKKLSKYDIRKKKVGSELEKIENYLKKFHPIVLPNNGPVQETLRRAVKAVSM